MSYGKPEMSDSDRQHSIQQMDELEEHLKPRTTSQGEYLAALEALRDEVLRQARNADEFTVDWGELSDLAERARKL